MTRPLAPALVLLLAACGTAAQPGEAPATATPAPAPDPSAADSGPDYTPPTLTPEAEKGEKGARNLLLSWAQAMEDLEFEQAYAVFGDYADRLGMSAEDYANLFADYHIVTIAIGDGTVEGAAGSLYYEVPVTLSGTSYNGKTYTRAGTVVLRRVNDVDGATPAQLRWHLDHFTWPE